MNVQNFEYMDCLEFNARRKLSQLYFTLVTKLNLETIKNWMLFLQKSLKMDISRDG